VPVSMRQSKQLSHKQLPTLWDSTFYVEQFKNFTLGGPSFGVGGQPSRNPIFGPNNCLINNFLHYEFQQSMLSSSKISLWKGNFLGGGKGLLLPPRTPKFGPNSCITNNFLHYEFQLSMLSSLKISLWDCHFLGGSPPRTPIFGLG